MEGEWKRWEGKGTEGEEKGEGHRPGVRATGAGGLQPPDSGKAIIFRAKAKFFRQNPQPKMKKIVFIKRKNGMHSV